LKETKPRQTVDIPDAMVTILEKFKDMMLPELPKRLSPQQALDHVIELNWSLELGLLPSSLQDVTY